MITNLEVGVIGEGKTCEYLKSRGYKILLRNFKKKFGEIDIIAKNLDLTLVFIEVKTIFTRSINSLSPEDNLTTQKYNKVKRTCEYFVAKYPSLVDEERGWRIDLVAVELFENGKFDIRHYENI